MYDNLFIGRNNVINIVLYIGHLYIYVWPYIIVIENINKMYNSLVEVC